MYYSYSCILEPSPYSSLSEYILFVAANMSEYENVVGGKLKLKGKALDVKAGGVKKKKKQKKQFERISEVTENELSTGGYSCHFA